MEVGLKFSICTKCIDQNARYSFTLYIMYMKYIAMLCILRTYVHTYIHIHIYMFMYHAYTKCTSQHTCIPSPQMYIFIYLYYTISLLQIDLYIYTYTQYTIPQYRLTLFCFSINVLQFIFNTFLYELYPRFIPLQYFLFGAVKTFEN